MPAPGLTGAAGEGGCRLRDEAAWRGSSSVDRGAGVGGQFLWIRGFGPVGMVNGENAKGPTALSRSQ